MLKETDGKSIQRRPFVMTKVHNFLPLQEDLCCEAGCNICLHYRSWDCVWAWHFCQGLKDDVPGRPWGTECYRHPSKKERQHVAWYVNAQALLHRKFMRDPSALAALCLPGDGRYKWLKGLINTLGTCSQTWLQRRTNNRP